MRTVRIALVTGRQTAGRFPFSTGRGGLVLHYWRDDADGGTLGGLGHARLFGEQTGQGLVAADSCNFEVKT